MDCKLQAIYIKILNPVFNFTSRVNEKCRNIIITAAYTFIALIVVMERVFSYYDYQLIGSTGVMLIETVLLAIITVFSIKEHLKPVKWNRLFYWTYFLFSFWMFAMCFVHHTGEGIRPFSIMLIIIFPCLYFVWDNRGDYESLFDKMALGTTISAIVFYIVQMYSVLHGNILVEGIRYQGTTANPNNLGMICIAFFVSAIYLAARNRKAEIIFFVIAGFALSLIFLSQSRGSTLSILAALIIWIVFYIGNKETRKNFLSLILALLIIGASAFAGDLAMDRMSDAYVQNSITEETQHEEAAAPSQAQTVFERFENTGGGINGFSSGRVAILKYHLKNLNMLGHDYTKAYENNLQDNLKLRKWAHNTILEYASRCGIPAGILFMIIEIMAAVYMVCVIVSPRRRTTGSLFAAMVIAAYGVQSFIDVMYLPDQYNLFMEFMIVLVVLGRRRDYHSDHTELNK